MSSKTTLESLATKIDDVVAAVVDLAQATGNMDVRLTGELRGVNRRLDGVETRLTGVERRLGNVENRVEGLEGQIGALTTVVRSVDQRLSVVEAR